MNKNSKIADVMFYAMVIVKVLSTIATIYIMVQVVGFLSAHSVGIEKGLHNLWHKITA